jgi:hypothetical protein
MISLEEIKGKLESAKLGDLYGDVVEHIEKEKKTGIDAASELRQEAAKLRKHKIALEKLSPLLGIISPDEVEGKLAEIEEKLKSAGKAKGSETELAKLTGKLDEFSRKFDELGAKEKRTRMTALKARLTADLKDKVHAADFVVDSLINSNAVDFAEDGDSIVWRDGETVMDYKSGTEKFLSERKEILKNTQSGGSGSNTNNRLPSGKPIYTQESLKGLSGKEIARVMQKVNEGNAEWRPE